VYLSASEQKMKSGT